MELDLVNGIKLLAIFQAIFFSSILIFSKNRRKISNFFIIAFQLLLALNVSYDFFPKSVVDFLGNFYVFLGMTAFLIPPVVYLYIISSLDSTFKLKKKQVIHLVPFILLNIILIPYVYLENYKENPSETDFHLFLNKAFYVAWYCQFLIYLSLSFFRLKHHKKHYVERFSSSDISRYNYLNWFVIIVSIVFTISAFKNFFVYNSEIAIIDYLTNIGLLSMLIMFCWTTYMAIHSPEIFNNDNEALPLVKDLIKVNTFKIVKNSKVEFDSDIKVQVEKIKGYMIKEEPFLNASLSLNDLSKEINIPVRELSILINHNLNQHFFDFVNSYRIKKAMQILQDPTNKHLTILEILYDVGFNSKSSFNTAFKKHTQLTPTQYRNNALTKKAS